MKRDKRKTLRLSEEEVARYEEAAHAEGVEFSEWVRRACETRLTPIKVPEGLREQITETLAASPDLYVPPLGLHADGCPCRRCNTTPTVATVARIDRKER